MPDKPKPKILIMTDIVPAKEKKPQSFFPAKPKDFANKIRPSRKKAQAISFKKIFALGAVLLLVVFGFYGVRLLGLKKLALESEAEIYNRIKGAKSAIKELNPEEAYRHLSLLDASVRLLYQEASRYGLLNVLDVFGNFADGAASVLDAFSGILKITESASKASADIAYLKANALELFLNGRGEELLAKLKSAQEKLNALPDAISEFQKTEIGFGEVASRNDLLSAQIGLYNANQILGSIISWLDSPKERHIAVIFENPSEIRPGGGFIGSFADVAIQRANLNHLKVNDIYDPDGQLESLVVPPEPLQKITKRWGARDANWFFDFPKSAEKVLHFLNSSKIYQEQNTNFEAVLAININVIKDLLSIVGDIDLPEYETTLTAENFLSQVQREVETGDDKAAGEPKRILKVLAPILLEKLGGLSLNEKEALLEKLGARVKRRDIRIWTKDLVLQQHLKQLGIASDMYRAEKGVGENYLAVVNANIAGGKTDAVISQKIELKSSITLEGKILNSLSISRKHDGDKEDDPWYRALNQNYMQIFVPLGTQPLSLEGRSKWPEIPNWDYADFSADKDVQKLESGRVYRKELGLDEFFDEDKTIFAFWANTERGESSVVNLTYELPGSIRLSEGSKHRFVFEKQSGAATSLKISITAPPGFVWAETEKSEFFLETEDPLGRVVVDLTLKHLN